ncbi:hypothetical protein FKM82_018661 [Ascaphus truei]
MHCLPGTTPKAEHLHFKRPSLQGTNSFTLQSTETAPIQHRAQPRSGREVSVQGQESMAAASHSAPSRCANKRPRLYEAGHRAHTIARQ